ncbi:MAG: bifunctional 3-deoxy-7-phosphoheptulonate synthase/chorismate mutase type II [Cyclobacteriaceae bacterium]|nr:bifunctional 3-deoxy-7-phosphoheptulonate synthase/chorismate mutase type II [Cyclobacteriaceae bacterium]MCX7638192.1 bifunctional 3-deoxy-7-phosphoheptulonate synthase/chorismate mutase type II [Cyclobacteriaceae bacterium]MDW8330013.1 chorismate mutase [Cyclobacteriaceae bacterium]
MKQEMNIQPLLDMTGKSTRPIIISGPCSAETRDQVLATARQLAATGIVHVLRAGIWKPRTRPGHFEGAGEEGLAWLIEAKEETGLPVATEVATARHVELCLKAGVDVLWVGARTTVNPFSVQEIADALRGVDVPVLVKNPVNPDLELWIGALERIHKAGITRLAAIHRGFSSFEKGPFRNAPLWDIAIDLKTRFPELPLICDPSHICGSRDLIPFIAQKALDLDMAGLMIESHIHPDAAWSDAKQQVTPAVLRTLVAGLVRRQPEVPQAGNDNVLAQLRDQIDKLDDEIMQRLAERMKISRKIGAYKKDNNITILQVSRWEEIIHTRVALGLAMGLADSFSRDLLKLIHQESIRVQEEVMNAPASGDSKR